MAVATQRRTCATFWGRKTSPDECRVVAMPSSIKISQLNKDAMEIKASAQGYNDHLTGRRAAPGLSGGQLPLSRADLHVMINKTSSAAQINSEWRLTPMVVATLSHRSPTATGSQRGTWEDVPPLEQRRDTLLLEGQAWLQNTPQHQSVASASSPAHRSQAHTCRVKRLIPSLLQPPLQRSAIPQLPLRMNV